MSLLLCFLISPSIFEDYQKALQSPPLYFRTPTLGSFLQELSGIATPFLRSLPLMIGIIFALGIFFRHGIGNARNAAILLVPLGYTLGPYGWIFDQVVLIPAVLFLARSSISRLFLLLYSPVPLLVAFLTEAQHEGIIIPVVLSAFILFFLFKTSRSIAIVKK
jgi:hypothetical protein